MLNRPALILLLTTTTSVVLNLKFEEELSKVIEVEDIKKSPYYKDKIMKVPISNEAGKELLQHWTDQAFSGLLSAIATRRLPLVGTKDRKKHELCSSEADDVVTHARCLVELEDDSVKNKWYRRRKYFQKKTRKTKKSNKWIGSFRTRAKRSIKVKTMDSYILKTEHDRSPFAVITKHLTNAVKIIKKKDKITKWQVVIDRIKKEADILKQKKKAENLTRKRMKVFEEGAKRLKYRGESHERVKGLRDPNMKQFASIEKVIEDEELREMFHQKTQNMTEEERVMMIPVELIRQAAKIGLQLGGGNTTDFDKKIVKIISPTFFGIVPEEEKAIDNVIDIFSPSLFSLHGEGTPLERNTSLVNILGSTMGDTDSQNFVDFLVEATGVAEAVEEAEEKIMKEQRLKDDAMGRGPDGQPLYFTKENITERYPNEAKKIELFEKLDKTYTIDQLRDFNRTGYTIMSPKQMELVYGRKSVFKNPKLLKTYKNMTKAELTRTMHSNIKGVADKKLNFEVRQKDVVLSPIVNTAFINDPVGVSQTIVLSPILFVPLIQSPAIYGVVILSPWLFVPVIVSPRLMSPLVLDPFMFVPVIVSPLALCPIILCPGVINPFILSPMVMCPFILSPQVMTPLILSPFALTPLILNPLLLSPLVLSPFVLSPQILSPQYVTAIILSPYALSPAIKSDGAMVTVVASPSWLS